MPSLPIFLPEGFSPSVAVSKKVSVGDVIAKRPAQAEVAINIAAELELSPKKATKRLKKNPGDEVQAGDKLAEKKNFFGQTTASVISQAPGKVIRYEKGSGTMFLQISGSEDNTEESIISPIEGTVSLCNNEKIVIETNKDVLVGTKGIGSEGSASFFVLNHSEVVEIYHLTADAIEKIIFGTYFPRDVLVKAASMGVTALIGTRIEDADIAYLRGKNLTLPIVEIAETESKKVKQWNGKKVFVNGEGKFVILLHN